ncbi:serine hydrolase domain-containing protein [Allokutzneria sp. NRRL B-24872]|uniref:serine hydrolase domain-containing protein n=1 Tax=Allokutzneria sp. NRRL B-24872 TaxID=1137961 RepID=UPI000A3607B6|nr:serine hydrolase domain-containing protein [Allokutzneria sp. NRRL B-24872]
MRSPALTCAALLTGLAVLGGTASAAPETSAFGGAGRFDRPHSDFAPQWTKLRDGSPEQVGLDRAPIDAAWNQLRSWTEKQGTTNPLYAGAVGVLVHDGVVVSKGSLGHALRYADDKGTELPKDEWVPMGADTIFDMASISKLFTTVAVMQQVERGKIDLDRTVASYLPAYAANGKEGIKVRQLLTHTTGMQPFIPLWRDWPDKASRIRATLESKLQQPPNTAYIYSDLNLITLAVLAEQVAGAPLDTLVRKGVTDPLGMVDTGYNPPKEKLHRVAATEFAVTPPRGMVRGEVHDENAWSLGGVAGHAGVFSTAKDMAVFGQMVLNGGSYGGKRVLKSNTLREMMVNYIPQFAPNQRGLGFEMNQHWYMDGLSGQRTVGHTGFTGTSLVIDPTSRSVAVLLTNRVHPTRNWGSNNPARRAFARGLAQAMSVRPAQGQDAWYSGAPDARNATLTTPALSGAKVATFDAFVDTEPKLDQLTVEASSDGGATWKAVPLRVSGRGAPDGAQESLSGSGHRSWWSVRAELPEAKDLALRWRYSTDAQASGRGVHLDGIRVWGSGGLVLDGERQPQRLTADGWQPRR